MREGLTLAEVLVTIAIVGAIAAISLSTMINNAQKQSAVSKVKKFYTNINQAIRLSQNENEHCSMWIYPESDDYEATRTFYNKYFEKYINTLKLNQESHPYETTNSKTYNMIKLSDGTVLAISFESADEDVLFYFYPEITKMDSTYFHRYRFVFSLSKTGCLIEPYINDWDGTKEQLMNHERYGCNKTSPLRYYCTKLMQYDGWSISKDYPW